MGKKIMAEQRSGDVSDNKPPKEKAAEGRNGDGEEYFTVSRERRSTRSSDADGRRLQDGSSDDLLWHQRDAGSSVHNKMQGTGSSLGCDSEEWQAARRSREGLPL